MVNTSRRNQINEMKTILFSVLLGLITSCSLAQEKVYDLALLSRENQLGIINRNILIEKDQKGDYIKVSESKGEGIVWLPVENFKTGTLTIEMRGKDVLQRSFIGIAFHGQNDSTYDAVYCRPFNFYAKDSVRKIHAIQYIAHPKYTWNYLRENRNAEFEKEIIGAPQPNDWFTMTLTIQNGTVKAYINDSTKPVLTISKLSNYHAGKIGLFVGDGSGGDFRKLTIVK